MDTHRYMDILMYSEDLENHFKKVNCIMIIAISKKKS